MDNMSSDIPRYLDTFGANIFVLLQSKFSNSLDVHQRAKSHGIQREQLVGVSLESQLGLLMVYVFADFTHVFDIDDTAHYLLCNTVVHLL